MSELERRLEDLGRGILETDRPISLLELELAPHDVVTGLEGDVDDDDVVVLRPAIRSRRRWQIFLAACVITFLAFLPFLLARSSDDDTADGTSPVTTPDNETTDRTIPATTPDPEKEAPWSLEKLGLSETFPTGPGGVVTGRWVRLDGVYYGRPSDRGTWMTSVDGLNWAPISADSNHLPPVGPSEAVAFHQSGVETYTTALDTSGRTLRVLEWVGGEWVEVPVAYPTPPEGVRFIPATDIGRPTMVVLRDGLPLTVARHVGSGPGTVAAGGFIYGIAEKDPERVRAAGEHPEYVLWRSDDGVDWSTVDMPGPARGELDWAYLTAGHDRLMLTIGVDDGARTDQIILTSTDGETWDEVEVPALRVPAVPEATDFGWMIQSFDGPDAGWFTYRMINLQVSSNGIDWEQEGGSWGGGPGYLMQPFSHPVVYEAGLFARKTRSSDPTIVWRIIDE